MSVRPKVHVVSGVSSAGKSTYLAQHVPSDITVCFPWQLHTIASEGALPNALAVHYNILRPWENRGSKPRTIRGRIGRLALARKMPSFRDDPPLRVLLELCKNADVEATVLVAPRRTLERRMTEREHVELSLKTAGRYPREKWLRILAKCDIQDVYSAWIDFLEESGVRYEIAQSVDGSFQPVNGRDDLRQLLASTND